VIFGEKDFFTESDVVEFARAKHLVFPQLNEVRLLPTYHPDLKDNSLPAQIISTIEEFDQPVVSYLSGLALGTGFELALGCHWRLASKNAKIGLNEASIGLIPSQFL
jgi:enoyl-CoA hydratase/carnithine racemase